MGVTTTAVREQVAHLLHEGFIQATRVRGEVGRPYYVYSLTSKAQDLFPKSYATLAHFLLEETLAMYGREGLRQLLNRVSRRIGETLEPATLGKELSQKLLGLVALLGEAGVEVSMQPMQDEHDNFVFKTHSCPYFEVAQEHREICDMEEEMLGDLMGPGVAVKLGNRIVDGSCSCDFHVSRVEQPSGRIGGGIGNVTSVGIPE
ncbi:MAG: hypothetical protein M3014_14625 [Chloroflexota bacterium]|nr:hypothetical protein [Chloroflexota bacterium]